MNQPHNIEVFYRVFRDISTLMHSKTHIDEGLNVVVKKSTEILNAKGVLLRIFNSNTDQFEVAAACGMGERYPNKNPVPSQNILTDEIRQNRILIIKDIRSSPRVRYPQLAWDEGICMILDVPLTLGVQVVGIIRVYLTEERDFSEEELDFIVSIAEQCACAINKARLLEETRAQYDQLALQTENISQKVHNFLSKCRTKVYQPITIYAAKELL